MFFFYLEKVIRKYSAFCIKYDNDLQFSLSNYFGILARDHHVFRCLIIAYKLRAKLCCGNKK